MDREQQQVYGLDKALKPLEYLVNTTLEKSSLYDFFNHLCTSLVPYIRASNELRELRLQWEKEKSVHQRRVDELEKEAISSVCKAFKLLKKRIALSENASTNEVEELILRISDILELREPYVIPPYYEIAGDKLCDLCSLLVSNGQIKLLKDIADVDFINRYEMRDGEFVTIPTPVLGACQFIQASTARKKEIANIWSWQRSDTAWVIWEYLCFAEQCWNLTSDDFKSESLAYNSHSDCKKSAFLLGLHSNWCEMQAIRQKKSHSSVRFFHIDRFCEYLRVLVGAIILHRTQNTRVQCTLEDQVCPYALELEMDANNDDLLLHVEWYENGKITTYLLKRFKFESSPQQFFQEILKKANTSVNCSEFGSDSSTVAKLLERANLQSPLKELFFKDFTTKKIALKTHRVIISQQSIKPSILREHIAFLELQVIKEDWSRKFNTG